MEISFIDKVVVITGATTGIGYKIVEGFVRDGGGKVLRARPHEYLGYPSTSGPRNTPQRNPGKSYG